MYGFANISDNINCECVSSVLALVFLRERGLHFLQRIPAPPTPSLGPPLSRCRYVLPVALNCCTVIFGGIFQLVALVPIFVHPRDVSLLRSEREKVVSLNWHLGWICFFVVYPYIDLSMQHFNDLEQRVIIIIKVQTGQ